MIFIITISFLYKLFIFSFIAENEQSPIYILVALVDVIDCSYIARPAFIAILDTMELALT